MATTAIDHMCRAVIVTALPIEFSAVCKHLKDRKEDTHPGGTVYERGLFRPGTGRDWEVIVIEIGAGNIGAAAEVERAITYCHPNVVLFVGVAGGQKDVAIGDVVAGSKVYDYESGKESPTFKPRPAAHESNYRLTQRAKAEARNGNWRERIIDGIPDPPPRVLVGPIAAGEKVVANSQSSTSQLIASAYGDALAVEMEGYGFLHGAYLNQHIAALVVRGISDLLDGKAGSDRNLASSSDHPVITKRYLLSLFYGGSHREALKVAQEKRAGGPAIPLISAIEVRLLEAVGDLVEAKTLLTQLIALEPDDPEHRITLAYLRYRSGDVEGSRQAVLGIAPEEVKGNAYQLMALAKVRAWLDLDGVLGTC